jgi:hypothetical protein
LFSPLTLYLVSQNPLFQFSSRLSVNLAIHHLTWLSPKVITLFFFFLPGLFPFCYLLHFCSPDPDFVLCWFFEVIQQLITIYT